LVNRGVGLDTPKAILKKQWIDFLPILGKGGYARYDESTATALLKNMRLFEEKYQGSILNLYNMANRKEENIVKLLKEFYRVGEVTINIFFRELRLVWPVDPAPTDRVVKMAEQLGINLSTMNRKTEEFMRLEAALLRMSFRKKTGKQKNLKS
jgi:hypothetical protein